MINTSKHQQQTPFFSFFCKIVDFFQKRKEDERQKYILTVAASVCGVVVDGDDDNDGGIHFIKETHERNEK